jgi:hypothetical protein
MIPPLALLFLCLQDPTGKESGMISQRANPVEARPDLSDVLSLVLAADLAGGFDSNDPRGATLFGGLKIGMPVALKGDYPKTVDRTVTLDIGYDRMQGRDGFSGELSLMLPVARFPAPHTPEATYLRVYFEPGGGYRFGAGDFGSYASAKGMIALFSDNRLTLNNPPPSVFVEIQRRVPLTSPLHGDTRLVIGLMFAVCNHCGLN